MRKSVLVIVSVILFSILLLDHGYIYFSDPPAFHIPRTPEKRDDLEFVCNLFKKSKEVGLHGGDLGVSFAGEGKVFFALGDVAGPPPMGRILAFMKLDNRYSNALGYAPINDFDCSSITWFNESGVFSEVYSSQRVPGDASTVPGGGLYWNDTVYLFMMRVHNWFAHPPQTDSFLLKSSDYSFEKVESFNEVFESRMVNVAPVLHEGWVYLFGTGSFRASPIHLARVRPENLEDKHSYEFFSNGSWVSNVNDSSVLVEGRVGELSVQELGGEFFMMYVDYSSHNFVLRRADEPWGPWSEGEVVMNTFSSLNWGETLLGSYYAPYIVPEVSNQSTIYFTVSLWWPYTVHLVKYDLNSTNL